MNKRWKFGRPSLAHFCWVLGYLFTLSVMLSGMSKIREQQLSGTSTKLEDSWKQWREAAAIQAKGAGPVKRKIPKSTLPPMQVLFADHYKTITLAAVIFGSFLYGMLYFFTQAIVAGDHRQLPDSGQHRSTTKKPEHPPD